MSVRTYNPSVRVGNWNEDIQLEEDTLKDFLERREKGELLYQKRSKLQQTLFNRLELSISRDGLVHFGDKVNLRCPGARDKTKFFAHVEPRADCQLAVSPAIQRILEAKRLEGPCNTAGSKELGANLRNTFVITSADGTPCGQPLRYGQKFFLCTLDNEGGSLFVSSDRATTGKSAPKSRHQDVTFVSEPSFLTEFQILHFNPQLRLEYEGIAVPANTKIIFNHKYTNQNLAVEEEFSMRTPYGTREYEISCNTYLDSHRADKEVNHWMIIMGVPGDEIYPVISNEASQSTAAS
ncbi:Cilia- and flagella-associated protein 161 [Mytilus coruscus]|uniref:Cilia- and flagella-associated protein 161 n=1 Tax=Mytilus coruscus TaxID=42192 RepID=A0A6J8DW07_MYTCO|nr:Cilia- and flagella-associated protein 161 [Mytilus coruscus]